MLLEFFTQKPQFRYSDSTFNFRFQVVREFCWLIPYIVFAFIHVFFSTAIDTMFQPLYIGCCLANAKSISIGQLFSDRDEKEMFCQYVYDFGDWHSHSITVTKFAGKVPQGASVGYLLSGTGGE